MNPKKRNRFQTFSVTRYLAGIIALALMAIVAGCPGPQTNSNQYNTNQRPSASPATSPIPTHAGDEIDTPIIINGGTIDIVLDPTYWMPNPSVPGKFTCTGCRLDGAVTVEPGEHLGACHPGSPSPSPSPTPTACPTPSPYPQGATIVIDGGGANKNITINSTTTGVDITFDPREYPGIANGPGQPSHFSNCVSTSKIKHVLINNQDCPAVPSNGMCKINIPVKTPRHLASPTPSSSATP